MTIIITCVGSGGANNLIKSIRDSKYADQKIIGVDSNRYLITKSSADKNYVVPKGSESGYVEAINKISDKENADLLIPQHESEIQKISAERDRLACDVLLPDDETVQLCLDKYELQTKLSELGFPVPETVSLAETDVYDAFEMLSDGEPLWFRTRYGSSSLEAQPVESPEQAADWIDRCVGSGMEKDSFTLSEFLPGKDFHILTFWNDGELVLGKGNERLSYFFGENTGAATPLVGRQIDMPELNSICVDIAEAIDDNPRGNLGFDFKLDTDGNPKLTEINVGKFSMVNNFFNLSGEYNMAELFLDTCFDGDANGPVDPFSDVDTDLFLVRGIDLESEIFSLEEIEATEEML